MVTALTGFFLTAVTKLLTGSNLREKGLVWLSLRWGKTWRQKQAVASHFVSPGRKEAANQKWPYHHYQTSRTVPRDPFPLVRLHLLKVLQLSKSMPPARDQEGTFPFLTVTTKTDARHTQITCTKAVVAGRHIR